jgi:hypothetical protein
MLKGNLATRPFYNERLVNLLLLLAAVAGIALAVFNTTRTIYLSGEKASRTAVQRNAEQEIERLNAETAKLDLTVDRASLLRLGGSTSEANSIIDQRTFSWTVLFGLLEKAIPMNARLLSVAPKEDRGAFQISMAVNAKTTDDLEHFIDAMLATGHFWNVLTADQQVNDDGTYTARIESGYTSPSIPPAKTATAGGRP